MQSLLAKDRPVSNDHLLLRIKYLENRLKQLELALFCVVVMFVVVFFRS